MYAYVNVPRLDIKEKSTTIFYINVQINIKIMIISHSKMNAIVII